MLIAFLLQELFLLKIVKFARPTFLILFTFRREAIKWMEKENDLYLLYKMTFQIFSEMSSTFTAEVLWLCSHMLHVLAPPLKEIQVITLLSIVYMDICVCPRLSRRLEGVRHSAASELPCTSHYLRAGNGWRFQQPLHMRGLLLHRAWAGGAHFRLTEVAWSGLTKGWVYVGTMERWRPAALSWYTGRRDHLTGIYLIPLYCKSRPGRKVQLSGSPLDPYSDTNGTKYLWHNMKTHVSSNRKHFTFCRTSLDTAFSWWTSGKVSFNINSLLVPKLTLCLSSDFQSYFTTWGLKSWCFLKGQFVGDRLRNGL